MTPPSLLHKSLVGVATAFWLVLSLVSRAASEPKLDFAKDARPFLDVYCAKCHNAEKSKGGINLDIFKDETSLYRHRARVEEVIEQLSITNMPPEDAKQPDAALRRNVTDWLRWKLDHFEPNRFRNPGYMPSHRLTRTQYRNTIRDLVGTGMEVAEDLPTDEATFGFDQIGDVQEVSSVHLEKYLQSAAYVLDRVFVPPAKNWSFDPRKLAYVRQFGLSGDDEKVDFPVGAPEHEVTTNAHLLFHTGGVTFSHEFPHTGLYRFKVRLWGDKAEDAKRGPSLKLKLDAHRVGETGVPTQGAARIEEPVIKAVVRAGRHDIKLEMEGMGVATNATDMARRFNQVGLMSIEVIGPVVENEAKAKEILDNLLVVRPGPDIKPKDAARKIVATFAGKAFRRPLDRDEIERLLGFFDRASKRGDTFEDAIKLTLKAVLVSPDFLFHIEHDRSTREPYRVTDFELANRLAYFLWSSMPDAELMRVAANGTLHEPTVLEAQTRRMLKDAKSRALADNFAPQWLGLGSLFAVHRDGKFHPNNLREREDLREEVVSSFDHLVREDRPITELLEADYAFVNEALAKHYGLPEVKGREFRKVALTGDAAKRRGGVLGMAAVHLAVSHPKDTNPSGRGKWVLDVLLGTPPPPPPPNVPQLPKEEKDGPKIPLRARLSQHRSDPNCAGCHAKIDPIGFALENYDNVGQWREEEAGKPLDVSGQMPGGRTINGPDELRKFLLTEKRALFRHNLTERLLTFALRRGLEFYDEGPVREIVLSVDREQDKVSALIVGVVKSFPFQFRQNPQMTSASNHE